LKKREFRKNVYPTLRKNRAEEDNGGFSMQKVVSADHLYQTKHHKLTTKTPHLQRRFLKNPGKNTTPPQPKKNLKNGWQIRPATPTHPCKESIPA
jgi:hypothetical protein